MRGGSKRVSVHVLGALGVLGACAAPRPGGLGAEAHDDPAAGAPRLRVAAYDLRWGPSLIGLAIERDDGARLTRRERIVVRRGDAIVVDELALTIERAGGRARAVTIERWRDGAVSRGRASASERGWDVALDGEAAVELPPATPFEDAVAGAVAAGGFRGPVLLAGYGFAIAELTIAPERGDDDGPRHDGRERDDDDGPRHDGRDWLATLALDGGTLAAHIRYGDDGLADEVRGGDGTTARRRPVDAPAPRFVPIEVVAGSAIAVERGTTAAGEPARALGFPEAAAPPPALPGQRVVDDPRAPGGWRIVLDPAAPGDLPPAPAGPDRRRDIDVLTARVAAAIEDDLAATATSVGAARHADRGDCTTHVLRFAADAADAGIATRIVTGLRLDGGSLVRHRWIVAWTGTRWLAVDPTHGESPAAPLLVGLAVHGARAAELALTDAVVFDRLGARAIALAD